MTDQTTAFEYCDEDGDDLIVRPMRGIPAVLILTGTNGIAVDLDRVEEVVAGIRDAARQAAGQTTTTTEQPVVAYRDPNNPRVLLCRQHGQSWHAITPVTAEDLPDGGLCTFGRLSSNECGRDVLAGQPAVEQPAEAQPSVRNVIEHALTVYYQDSSAPSAVARALLSQDRAEILREAADRFEAFDLRDEAAALRRMAEEQP